MKVGSGWYSDRLPLRKPLVAAGYGLSAVGKLLLATAFHWPQVLVARTTDRFGKGVRTSPRDALIADFVDSARCTGGRSASTGRRIRRARSWGR